MFDVIPACQSGGNYEEFTNVKDSGAKSFIMKERKYTNGCTWSGTSDVHSFSVYNLNGQYKTIRGTLGHVDRKGKYDATLYIYTDGVLYNEILMSAYMASKDIIIDVSGVTQLKMLLKGWGSLSFSTYGFGDVLLQ